MGAAYRTRGNGDRPTAPAATTPTTATTRSSRSTSSVEWRRQEVVLLAALDAAAVGAATLLSKMWNFGLEPAELEIRSITIPYIALAGAIVPTWLAVLALTGAYDVGPFGTPSNEYGRVIRAGAYFVAVVAVAYFILHIEKLTRGFLAATAPLALVLTLGVRAVARLRRRTRRARGEGVRRAVVVGSRRSVAEVAHHLAEHPASGLVVVGACVPGPVEPMLTRDMPVPVLGGTDEVLDALGRSGADVVIFTGSLALGRVRTLAWKVEGSGIDVFVVPSLTQPAGQTDVRPVAGLPLVYVDRLPGAVGKPVPPPVPAAPPPPRRAVPVGAGATPEPAGARPRPQP
ncbi:MAG TPA: hypothetical protein VIL48_20765 [Acidimicrobiales bacterium]